MSTTVTGTGSLGKTTFLIALREVLASLPPLPTLVVGDFNLRVPRKGTPEAIYGAFQQTFRPGFEVATEGSIVPMNQPTIDHVLHTRDLEATEVRGLSNTSPIVKRLSDHFGMVVTLCKKK